MHPYVVEFVGTLLLMFVIVATGNYLAIGATLAIAVLLGGGISGGAFNPAVAIGMVLNGQLPSRELMPYVLSQVLGAVVAVQLFQLVPPFRG